jgi:crossover junction endodeoxyribonuclease RuvC
MYIAVDPGICKIGIGAASMDGEFKVIGHEQCKIGDSKISVEKRLLKVKEETDRFIKEYQAEFVVVEDGFVNAGLNKRTPLDTAMARGAVMVAAAENNIPVYRYSPSEVKLAMTGKGNANKEMVQMFVKAALHLDSVAEDEADAIAILYTHYQISKGFYQRKEKPKKKTSRKEKAG